MVLNLLQESHLLISDLCDCGVLEVSLNSCHVVGFRVESDAVDSHSHHESTHIRE